MLTREGHFEAALQVMAYLKVRHNSHLPLDPTYPAVEREKFKKQDWTASYGDAEEAIPPNAPVPLGMEVEL